MFSDAWAQRTQQAKAMAKSYERQIAELDRKISGLLDRIVDATSSTVMAAFEKRIDELEREKLILDEKRQNAGKPQGTFEELFELAFAFLANPSKLWASGKIEYQKLVLKLGFADRLHYCPNSGFRTPNYALPFKMLGGENMRKNDMSESLGRSSNFCSRTHGLTFADRWFDISRADY